MTDRTTPVQYVAYWYTEVDPGGLLVCLQELLTLLISLKDLPSMFPPVNMTWDLGLHSKRCFKNSNRVEQCIDFCLVIVWYGVLDILWESKILFAHLKRRLFFSFIWFFFIYMWRLSDRQSIIFVDQHSNEIRKKIIFRVERHSQKKKKKLP